MTDFTIPCATYVRLAKVLRYKHPEMNAWFQSVRIDNGVALASNRRAIVGENIGGPSGICHITIEPALIAQCEREAPFDSLMHISVNETLRFASAKTTMGYQFPGNALVSSAQPNKFDEWRDIVKKASIPAKKPHGGMFWNAELMTIIAECSVSGRIVFEEIVDTSRPTIVRDIVDPNWFACFIPFASDERYEPAKFPEWLK